MSESKQRSGGGVLRAPFVVFLLASVPLLAVYVAGLRRGLGVIDSGELAAVCHTLGIAHPPGYPLYTLLGRLGAVIPFGSILTRMHLLSTLLSAAACGFAALAIRETLRQIWKDRSRAPLTVLLVPVLGAWAWGLTPAVWPQAVENEVYGLHFVFLTTSLWIGALLLRIQLGLRLRILLVYLLGLGLSHHLSLAFALPTLALALLAQPVGPSTALSNSSRMFGRLWMVPALFLVLGLTIQIYLPVRSALDPFLDWGDPANAARWFRHATGWQYRTWIGAESMGERAIAHMGALPGDVGWVLPVAAIIGLFVLWHRRIVAAAFWSLLLAVGILWASSYDIKDIASYYAASDLACVVLGTVGLVWLIRKLEGVSGRKWLPRVLIAITAALVVLGASLRWNRCAASGPRLPDIYARAFMDGLPPNTLLVSQQWDIVVSASYYLQLVGGVRPDVVIVDPELMRRSWYFPQLERRWPGLLEPVRALVEAFSEDVALFESGRAYDPASIEGKYQAVQRGLVDAYAGRRPVASTPEINPALFTGRESAPHGLVWLWDSGQTVEGRGPLPPVEPFLERGPRTEDILSHLMRRNIGAMALARAAVLEQRGDTSTVAALRQEAELLRQRILAGP